MNEQDLRVMKTKENLQRALIELLKDKPLEKITVTELCGLAGITRKTFYLHYENVAKYFEEFIERLLNELEESMQNTSRNRMAGRQLEPQMVYLFEHVYCNKNFYQFIFSSNSNFAYYKMFYNRIKLQVRKSIDSMNVYGEMTEFDVSFHANAILGVIMEWYMNDFQQSVDEMNGYLLKVLKNSGLE